MLGITNKLKGSMTEEINETIFFRFRKEVMIVHRSVKSSNLTGEALGCD